MQSISPEWVTALAAVFGLLFTVSGAVLGYVIAQDRRITRLEDRTQSLGQQLVNLPKRKGD